ncbi:unnamed protein product [Gadus morhua 'NCC']
MVDAGAGAPQCHVQPHTPTCVPSCPPAQLSGAKITIRPPGSSSALKGGRDDRDKGPRNLSRPSLWVFGQLQGPPSSVPPGPAQLALAAEGEQ